MSVWAESKINIDLHDLNWVAATGDMCQCECVRRFFQRKPDRPPSNCSHSSVFPTIPSQYFPLFHLYQQCQLYWVSSNCSHLQRRQHVTQPNYVVIKILKYVSMSFSQHSMFTCHLKKRETKSKVWRKSSKFVCKANYFPFPELLLAT